MRISFVGSTPFPPRRDQAGTCIMIELGNGKRFLFDFGSGLGGEINRKDAAGESEVHELRWVT